MGNCGCGCEAGFGIGIGRRTAKETKTGKENKPRIGTAVARSKIAGTGRYVKGRARDVSGGMMCVGKWIGET